MAEKKVESLQKPILWGTLVNYSFNFAYSLIAALLVEQAGFTTERASMILTIAFAVAAVLQVYVGRLIDRGHYKIQPIISFIGNAIGVAAIFSGSIWIVTFGVSMILMSAATLQTLSTHLLEGLSTEENRPHVATQSYMFANLGFGISSLLAFFLIHNWRGALLTLDVLTTGVYCFILGTALLKVAPPKIHPERPRLRDLSKLLSVRLGLVFIASLGLYITISMPFFALQLLYKTMGLDSFQYSTVVLGINSVVVLIGGLILPTFTMIPWVRIVIASGMLCLGLTLQPLTSSLLTCAAFTVLWSIGEIFIVGDISHAFFRCFSAETIGFASGLKVMTFRGALILCPLMVTLFNPTTFLQYFTLFGLPAIVGGLSLILSLAIKS